jgi:hypothetical protein
MSRNRSYEKVSRAFFALFSPFCIIGKEARGGEFQNSPPLAYRMSFAQGLTLNLYPADVMSLLINGVGSYSTVPSFSS